MLCSTVAAAIWLFLFSVNGHLIPSLQVHWKSPLSVFLPNLPTSLLPSVFPLLNCWLAAAFLLLPWLPIPSQSFAPACTALPDASCPHSLCWAQRRAEELGCAAGVVWLVHHVKNPPVAHRKGAHVALVVPTGKPQMQGGSGLLCPATHTTTSLYCDREWLVQHSLRMFLDPAVGASTCLQLALLLSFCAVISFVSQFLALIFLSEV